MTKPDVLVNLQSNPASQLTSVKELRTADTRI